MVHIKCQKLDSVCFLVLIVMDWLTTHLAQYNRPLLQYLAISRGGT